MTHKNSVPRAHVARPDQALRPQRGPVPFHLVRTPVAMFFAAAISTSASAQTVLPKTELTGTTATTVTTELLKTARVPAGYQPTFDPTTRRSRFVSVQDAAFDDVNDESGGTVKLNLFSDATLDGLVTRVQRRGPNRFTFGGQIAGDPHGSFTLVREGNAIVAEVHSSTRGNYEIRTVVDGVEMVRQVNDTRLAGCGSSHAHAGQAFPQVRSVPAEGDGPVLDLMIVYTATARAAAGGTSAMQAVCQLFVDATNSHFTNSQINSQARLVYCGEVNYPESGSANTDLDRLTFTGDGYLEEVHTLRNQYGADQVTLLVNQFDYCGIAWMHYGPTRAFSVVDWGCGSATFAHELGHNLGCAHDRQNSRAPGYYPYSYGHRFFGQNGQQFRTVMSYAPGTRIPYFSNPAVLYSGTPTGIPDNLSNSANNARTVNLTAPTVSGYRPAADIIDCNGNFLPDSDDIASGRSADCNGNAIPDECDVATARSRDENHNLIPDECECDASACDDGVSCTVDSCDPNTGACRNTFGGIPYGDVNYSGIVDLTDVTCVLDGYENFATCPSGDIAPCGGDGRIDVSDVLAVLAAYNGVYHCPNPCP